MTVRSRPWLSRFGSVVFLMIRRPPRSTQSRSSAASDVYKRQRYCRCRSVTSGRPRGDGNPAVSQPQVRTRVSFPVLFLTAAIAGLAAGGVLWVADAHRGAEIAWAITTGVGLGPAVFWVSASLLRRQPGVDVIAVLALAGALAVGEYLAGAVIA